MTKHNEIIKIVDSILGIVIIVMGKNVVTKSRKTLYLKNVKPKKKLFLKNDDKYLN